MMSMIFGFTTTERTDEGLSAVETERITELDALRGYLAAKAGVTEERPFGPGTLVFKVVGKMFALVAWEEEPLRINLKCNPYIAEMLRTTYAAVLPGYHMNKRHWNTVILDGSIPEDEIREMIDESYRLVVKGLRKADQDALALKGSSDA